MSEYDKKKTLHLTQPGAHFDQLLRQTRIHHQQLSVMADTKANMLLTVSSVVLTLSIPLLTQDTIRWIGISLIISAFATILLASYAIMPKRIGRVDPSKPGNNPYNLLFFGHFVNMSYEEFETAWEKLLNDPALTYQAQIQEIYGLGNYLAAYKYKYLRLAYLSFVGGLFVAGVLAVISLYYPLP